MSLLTMLVRWEKCMQELVGKYPEDSPSPCLLPVLKYLLRIRTSITGRINRNLKEIAKLADISVLLSMCCVRHSWASTANDKNIPISVISEGMGHDFEATTQIYQASLDNVAVGKGNYQILKDLLGF